MDGGRYLGMIYSHARDAVARQRGDRVILLPTNTEDAKVAFFELDEPGRAVWDRLDGHASLGDVSSDLAECYGAPFDEILRDVIALISELARHKLVTGPVDLVSGTANGGNVAYIDEARFSWQPDRGNERPLASLDIELTARCNLNCRHCYARLPIEDAYATALELTDEELDRIADEGLKLGLVRCLLTGGEPLLSPDFPRRYARLRSKGLLLTIFTNTTLITPKHVQLFRAAPPDLIEVTIYGATQACYERVTRVPGSYRRFRDGLSRLLDAGLRVRLKAMVMRSNLEELEEMASFAKRVDPYFRFSPFLFLRHDGCITRNAEIVAERLSAAEIKALAVAYPDNQADMKVDLREPDGPASDARCLVKCSAGQASGMISYDGKFRLCTALSLPEATYDLRSGSLREAWEAFVPAVRRELRSEDAKFLSACGTCRLLSICFWCPGRAYLECGRPDRPVPYYCAAAHELATISQHRDSER